MTTVFPTGDKEAFSLAPRRGPDSFPAWAKKKPCYSTVGYLIRHVLWFSPSLNSFFLAHLQSSSIARGRRRYTRKSCDVIMCRSTLFASCPTPEWVVPLPYNPRERGRREVSFFGATYNLRGRRSKIGTNLRERGAEARGCSRMGSRFSLWRCR